MRASAFTVVAALAALAVTPACIDELDPPWQLDHDRVVAVRATPPGLAPGGRAVLDGLVALAGEGTREQPPDLATVVSPESLAGAVSFEGGAWVVDAPDADRLAAARAELGLAADAPIALVVGAVFGGARQLAAIKTVMLGAPADNPTMPAVRIGDAGDPAPGTELIMALDGETRFEVEAADTDKVVWLTSCGTMHDFDLRRAYLTIEPEDPTEGELALVVRDDRGGVIWHTWPVRAE